MDGMQWNAHVNTPTLVATPKPDLGALVAAEPHRRVSPSPTLFGNTPARRGKVPTPT